ncbi:DUF1971 domain-containing protein, partial [Klebsiella pneumoniae]|uniref:DUF1971 domain-containing protein n=1 Tax=Klebsiella pneumoniae TaxID=573 RepID=UPI0020CF05E0
ETLTIEAGQFGVFPPEKWHCIEALSEDTVLSRRPSGLRKTRPDNNSLAHRTTWLRSDF